MTETLEDGGTRGDVKVPTGGRRFQDIRNMEFLTKNVKANEADRADCDCFISLKESQTR